MKQEKINREIAFLLGWKEDPKHHWGSEKHRWAFLKSPLDGYDYTHAPDYCNDRNLIPDILEKIKQMGIEEYVVEGLDIWSEGGDFWEIALASMKLPPLGLCIAFLKVANLWKEEWA